MTVFITRTSYERQECLFKSFFKLTTKKTSKNRNGGPLWSSWGQHGAHLGPVGPRWAPCWPHEPCYQGWIDSGKTTYSTLEKLWPILYTFRTTLSNNYPGFGILSKNYLIYELIYNDSIWTHFPNFPFLPRKHVRKITWLYISTKPEFYQLKILSQRQM